MRSIFLLIFIPFIGFAQENRIDSLVKSDEAIYRYDEDWLSPEFYNGRRRALRDSMPANSVAVFFSNPIRNKSNDIDHEYHQNPNLYYLTGFIEPNSMLLVFKEDVEIGVDSMTSEILVVQDRNLEKEIWNGRRLGSERVSGYLGIETGLIGQNFADLNVDFGMFDHVYHEDIPTDLRDNKTDRGDLYSLIRHFKKKTDTISDRSKFGSNRLETIMNSLREVKEEEELVLMRKAIDITCEAQMELMRSIDTGWAEYNAEALVEFIFKYNGAEKCGFPSILGGGENSCVLHYTSNRKVLEGNHLLVSDIGAEYHGYSADVTRTIPVDGEFSEEEAQIYELVLKAQKAGIEACEQGNKFWDPHTAATKVIQRGLMDLGITSKYYQARQYFMHGTSHYLGLDVHDAGNNGALRPGNVITVEPGIYIPSGSDCDPKWWNIGIRIEDDILITTNGPVNLSEAAPREIEEIETMMKENSGILINNFLE